MREGRQIANAMIAAVSANAINWQFADSFPNLEAFLNLE